MTKEWSEVREEIKSLTASEKEELTFIASLVSEIVKRRQELGFTQRELSKRSGIPQPAIARLETLGVTPSLETIFKLMGPLDLSLQLIRKEEKTKLN